MGNCPGLGSQQTCISSNKVSVFNPAAPDDETLQVDLRLHLAGPASSQMPMRPGRRLLGRPLIRDRPLRTRVGCIASRAGGRLSQGSTGMTSTSFTISVPSSRRANWTLQHVNVRQATGVLLHLCSSPSLSTGAVRLVAPCRASMSGRRLRSCHVHLLHHLFAVPSDQLHTV